MTKIKLEFESSEEVEKVIIDVKYAKPKKAMEIHSNEIKTITSEYQPPKETKVKDSHGFDTNMMNIVNS